MKSSFKKRIALIQRKTENMVVEIVYFEEWRKDVKWTLNIRLQWG